MDSQDYLEVRIGPLEEQEAEIVVAFVSELGYDAFQYEAGEQKCYIQSDLFSKEALEAALESFMSLSGADVHWSAEKMPAVNWNQQWEQSGFTAIECGRFVIVPGQEKGTLSNDGFEPIYLNAGMAFGTGHHHTTFMMLQTMQSLAESIRGASVVDLGCGTAVLAIAAAKLGASKVEGVDIDAVAVRSAKENLKLNGMDFPLVCSDASALKEGEYDVLLANIHRNIIIADLPVYAKAVREGGILLVSGFLDEDVEDIVNAAELAGFDPFGPQARRCIEGWNCIAFAKR